MTSRMLDELGLLAAEGREARVRFERTFAVPPEGLWSALTEPARVERWLGRLSGDLRVGGAYTLDMADPGDDDPAAQRATGEVLVCDAPDRLLLTWRFPGEDPSEIEARVRPSGAGSVLLLEHRRLTRGAARGYGAGWHTFLDRLGLLLLGREDEWTDRFEELLPTYRGLLPAVGPTHVDVVGGTLVSADPPATAAFLHAWLGWDERGAVPAGAMSGRALSDGAVPDGAVSDRAVPDGAVSDGAVSGRAVLDTAVSAGTSSDGAASAGAATEEGSRAGSPSARRLVLGGPGGAVVALVPGGPAVEPAPVGARLAWSDVDALRESLVSAVGSGGRLAAGQPGDVDADGTEVVCPGGVRLHVRAEAVVVPGA